MNINKCDDCVYCTSVATAYPRYGIPAEIQSDCIICTDMFDARITCIEARTNIRMCGPKGNLFQEEI